VEAIPSTFLHEPYFALVADDVDRLFDVMEQEIRRVQTENRKNNLKEQNFRLKKLVLHKMTKHWLRISSEDFNRTCMKQLMQVIDSVFGGCALNAEQAK